MLLLAADIGGDQCTTISPALLPPLLPGSCMCRYGHPEPSQVCITPTCGKAILISGHDLHDLEDLLLQTQGTGIKVWTHGEMLPAHGYPGLKRFEHLAGERIWMNAHHNRFDLLGGRHVSAQVLVLVKCYSMLLCAKTRLLSMYMCRPQRARDQRGAVLVFLLSMYICPVPPLLPPTLLHRQLWRSLVPPAL